MTIKPLAVSLFAVVAVSVSGLAHANEVKKCLDLGNAKKKEYDALVAKASPNARPHLEYLAGAPNVAVAKAFKNLAAPSMQLKVCRENVETIQSSIRLAEQLISKYK